MSMSAPVWLFAAASKDKLQPLSGSVGPMCAKDYQPQKFDVPASLKFGSFNNLVKLSEDLAKSDSEVETCLRRIERQILELEPETDVRKLQVLSQGASFDWKAYVSKFTWDDAKFPRSRPVSDTLEYLVHTVQQLDEGVRTRGQNFTDLKNQAANTSKKDVSTLVTKELIDVLTPGLVKAEDFVESEHITTACVIVPRGAEKLWESTYETPQKWVESANALDMEITLDRTEGQPLNAGFTADKANLRITTIGDDGLVAEWNAKFPTKELKVGDLVIAVNAASGNANQMMAEIKDGYASGLGDKVKLKVRRTAETIKEANIALASKLRVVPRSTKQLPGTDKDQNTLWRVMVFRDALEGFKKIAREKKFLVRDFTFSADDYQKLNDSRAQLDTEIAKQETHLMQFSKAAFSDTVVAWVHLKAMRMFVEAVLRFGVEAHFEAFALEPQNTNKSKIIHSQIQTVLGPCDKGQQYTTKVVGQEEGEDFFSYVFLPFSVVS